MKSTSESSRDNFSVHSLGNPEVAPPACLNESGISSGQAGGTRSVASAANGVKSSGVSSASRPRIALWFRYGPAEHAELFHAIPDVVEKLAEQAEVHYFGCKSHKPVPERIQQHAHIHHLPFTVDRTSNRDKMWKTLLWLLALPYIGLWCRFHRIQAVYIDETVPLSAPLARLFFGRRVALTVADFFIDIYAVNNRLLGWVGGLIKALDYRAWRRLPVIFTRAQNTRDFLAEHGVAPEHVFPVYDPCDFSVYHPLDRTEARAALGLREDAVVLVHHGILHPNKGNDRILQAIAQHQAQFPALHYLLIGDGPDMPRLRELTQSLGIAERVTFTGWLPTLAEVNQALNAGDIGLVMRIGQRSDDFHMTGALVHSMACGLPVLAARLAGIAEVVRDDHNGYLFDPHTLQDFADQLQRLYDDAATRHRLGEQALADAHKHFDMANVTEQTVRPLLKLLES